MNSPVPPRREGASARWRWLALGALIVTALWVAHHFGSGGLPRFISSIRELGFAGVALFVGVYIAACILFIPGSILTLGAGALYGVVGGSICVSVASTLGATSAFLIGRYLIRDRITARVADDRRFQAIGVAVAKGGWRVVGLTRLSPLLPFNLLNYAFGLTQVSLRDYVLASWIGMIPGTVMYVYLGAAGGDLLTSGRGGRERSGTEWALYGVGLVATVIVSIYVARLAKRELAQTIPQ